MHNSLFTINESNCYIKSFLEENLEQYGKMNFAYMVINKTNADDTFIISDMPDYFNNVYLSNKYQYIDPIITNARNRVTPVIWNEEQLINSQHAIRKKQVRNLFNSVKPFNNIISGQTFVLHTPNNQLVLLSLYINKFLRNDIDYNVKKNTNNIQGLLINSHEKLLNTCHEEKNRNPTNNESKLSFRESEILYLSSIGKTNTEIARILNITVSTVKFHMGSIVKKLGVNNAKHAISLSLELNILTPPPWK